MYGPGAWFGAKAMLSEVERVGARSMVGRYFSRVGGWNLGLLLLFAIADGALGGFGAVFFVEYVLLVVLLGLAGAHGAYFNLQQKLEKMSPGGPNVFVDPAGYKAYVAERQASAQALNTQAKAHADAANAAVIEYNAVLKKLNEQAAGK